MTIKVLLDINAKPESIETLKKALMLSLPETREYDGCLGVEVEANQDNALNLLLIERWESREQYENYTAWRTETGGMDALVSMLSAPPRVLYLDNLDI